MAGERVQALELASQVTVLSPSLHAVQFGASYFTSGLSVFAGLLGGFEIICIKCYAQCLTYDRNT